VYTLFDAMSNSRIVGFLGRKIFVVEKGTVSSTAPENSTAADSGAMHDMPVVAKGGIA
jgi:hypothetical protein